MTLSTNKKGTDEAAFLLQSLCPLPALYWDHKSVFQHFYDIRYLDFNNLANFTLDVCPGFVAIIFA